jgi:hypothetical protein
MFVLNGVRSCTIRTRRSLCQERDPTIKLGRLQGQNRKACLPMQPQLESLMAIPISAHMDILPLLSTISPFSRPFRTTFASLSNEQTSYVDTSHIGIETPYLVFLRGVCAGWNRYGRSAFMLRIGEVVGYIGRVGSAYDVTLDLYFIIQICCLIFAPAFFSAGLYLAIGTLYSLSCFGVTDLVP